MSYAQNIIIEVCWNVFPWLSNRQEKLEIANDKEVEDAKAIIDIVYNL